MSQTGSLNHLAPTQFDFLNGTASPSRNCPKSFSPSNSHLFVRWELPQYYLRSVRIGLSRQSGTQRLSPTRPTCSRLKALLDLANGRTFPPVKPSPFIWRQVTVF